MGSGDGQSGRCAAEDSTGQNHIGDGEADCQVDQTTLHDASSKSIYLFIYYYYLRLTFFSFQQVPGDVVPMIKQIVDCIARREYLAANDVYLRLAIGNAPWPMGVTMVRKRL